MRPEDRAPAQPFEREVPELFARIRRLTPLDRQTALVAVAGRGGSGKTTLANRLANELGATVVHTDDFARPRVPGWDWQRCYDQVLSPLLRGEPAHYQRYDWDSDRLAEWHDVSVGGVVILEGVSVTRRALKVPWDLTIWVETPTSERLSRGIARDGEHMRAQWENVWEVEEADYVRRESPAQRADVIVHGDS